MSWHTAILQGKYLRGTRCLVLIDADGKILDCNAIHSLWSNSPRFDEPFRDTYNPLVIYDGGEEFRAWVNTLSDDPGDELAPVAA